MTDWSKEILKENIIRACQQFNRYALLSPVDRNQYLIETLKEMLSEAERYQTELALFDTMS